MDCQTDISRKSSKSNLIFSTLANRWTASVRGSSNKRFILDYNGILIPEIRIINLSYNNLLSIMRLFSLLAGCSLANHTQIENGMGLKDKDGELIDWGNPFEIVHCNNPSTDYPEMKARVIG